MTTQPLLHQELALQRVKQPEQAQIGSISVPEARQQPRQEGQSRGWADRDRLSGWLQALRPRHTREQHATG